MPTGNEYNPVLGAYMDEAAGRRLLTGVFQFHGLEQKAHWADDATRNIPIHYFYAYEAQAAAEDILGNRAASQQFDAHARQFEALSKR
jgi:hypothetical protein